MLPILEKFGPLTPWAISVLALWIGVGTVRFARDRRTLRRAQSAANSGDPVSLHPVIDPMRCIGCNACVNACPESKVIGVFGGKAHLLDPAGCIGHGACKTACPVSAIDLVFGSARRGIDIPVVTSDFETNVPGLFVAGELGGMGLIANAIEQGRQAVAAIAKLDGLGQANRFDLVVVGAGPAGISAALAAKERGLIALTLEQDSLGGTVAKYPRNKIAMTRPAYLPLYGKVRLRRVRKERLLALWQDVIRKARVTIRHGVTVEAITPAGSGFKVRTTAGTVACRAVLMATGRRGQARQLGVPGEDLPKVALGLGDARRYRGKHVLVVGGGDSAAEAAIALADHHPLSIVLAVRRETLSAVKAPLRQKLEQLRDAGRIAMWFSTEVTEIGAADVTVKRNGTTERFRNDAVIVCIGGSGPARLLADAGVRIETHYGQPMR